MRPALKENVTGKYLVFPAIYPMPYSLRNALRHIRAKEGVVHIHIEMERKGGVFGHSTKLHNPAVLYSFVLNVHVSFLVKRNEGYPVIPGINGHIEGMEVA